MPEAPFGEALPQRRLVVVVLDLRPGHDHHAVAGVHLEDLDPVDGLGVDLADEHPAVAQAQFVGRNFFG